jgi:hypothetical protein
VYSGSGPDVDLREDGFRPCASCVVRDSTASRQGNDIGGLLEAASGTSSLASTLRSLVVL